MLNNILNIEGVAVLSKREQKQIKGGDTCYLRVEEGGNIWIYDFDTDDANDLCVQIRLGGADRCQYDCGFDGYTAPWLASIL